MFVEPYRYSRFVLRRVKYRFQQLVVGEAAMFSMGTFEIPLCHQPYSNIQEAILKVVMVCLPKLLPKLLAELPIPLLILTRKMAVRHSKPLMQRTIR